MWNCQRLQLSRVNVRNFGDPKVLGSRRYEIKPSTWKTVPAVVVFGQIVIIRLAARLLSSQSMLLLLADLRKIHYC